MQIVENWLWNKNQFRVNLMICSVLIQMEKADINPMPSHFDRYINITDD